MIEIRAIFDRLTGLWAFVCDCGYEIELNTYSVMRRWRRMHAQQHPFQKVVCT